MKEYVKNPNFVKNKTLEYVRQCLIGQSHPVIFVVGPSGSGKSLFVMNELVPALREEFDINCNVIEDAYYLDEFTHGLVARKL